MERRPSAVLRGPADVRDRISNGGGGSWQTCPHDVIPPFRDVVRMTEQDRLSQASSLVTISSFPVQNKGGDYKVQNFGKRSRAVKRDPNCPVVIRGWLFKQDSSGLKLWKRRWFVLSDFCLFYYKDSREEAILGSIPLPSYKILFCTPRECKNRKYAFKAVHQGMRSYFFSADTQEDMLGWVRALSQSASMESESSLNRRCASYQDFTQIGGSSESLTLFQVPSARNCPTPVWARGSEAQNGSSHPERGAKGTPQLEQKSKQKVSRYSSSPRTSAPTASGRQRSRGQSLNQEGNDPDGLPFSSSSPTPTPTLRSTGSRPLTPRGQLGSRPHTPVGRVDIRPHEDPLLTLPGLGSSPPSPQREFSPSSLTPSLERKQPQIKSASNLSSPFHVPAARRAPGKANCHGGQADLLPPLPPPRMSTAPAPPPHHHHHHHHHHRSPVSVCVLQPAMPATSDLYQQREQQSVRPLESEVDAMLTRLCGCDKLLQALSVELAQLQAEKDHVQCALEMTRLHLEEWNGQGPRAKEVLSQKALLQEELVTVRARMCDVSLEMERVWGQYERLESELSVFRSHLQHVCRFGRPQEQSQAQRELWMMEDILCGLKANRNHFQVILGSQRQTMSLPVLQKSVLHAKALGPPADRTSTVFYSDLSSLHRPLHQSGLSVLPGENQHADMTPAAPTGCTASCWSTPDTASKRARMSEEEQTERMRRNQERVSSQKKTSAPSQANHIQRDKSSPPTEEPPFPLRVSRILTAVLPSTQIARRVSVEDPPPDLAAPFLEQIFPEVHPSIIDQNKKHRDKLREKFAEKTDQNSTWWQAELTKDMPKEKLRRALSREMSGKKSNLPFAAKDLLDPNKQQAVEDKASSRLHRISQLDALSGPTAAALQDHFTEGSKSESDFGLSSSTCDRSEEDPVPSGAPSAKLRREKAGLQASLLAAGVEHELSLSREQREAKLRRVERIRERVAKSAARENNLHPFAHRTGSNRESPLTSSLPLPNDDSRKIEDPTHSGIAQEHQDKEGLDRGNCFHSDGDPDLSPSATTEPKPTRIPFRNSSSRGGGEEGDFDVKYCGKMPVDHHGLGGDSKTAQGKGSAQKKPASSRHHVTKMTVVPPDGSVEKTQHCFSHNAERETKEEVASAGRFSKERTEWFLSTSHKVELVPLANQNAGSVSSKKSVGQNLCSKDSDFICKHPVVSSNVLKCVSSTTSRIVPNVSETNATSLSAKCPQQLKSTSEDPTTSVLPSVENLDRDDQSLSGTEKLYQESVSRSIDESTAPLCRQPLPQPKNEVIFQILANRAKRQKNHESSKIQGSNLTGDTNGTRPELLTNQAVTTYATIQFVSPADTGAGQNDEKNSRLTLDAELLHEDVPANTGQDSCLTTKSSKDVHVYEQITYSAAPFAPQSGSVQDTLLAASASPSQLSQAEGLASSLKGESVSPSQSDKIGTEKENVASDWSAVNKLTSQGQAGSDGHEGSIKESEDGKQAQLRKHLSSYDTEGSQGSQFLKARVTVVRTSL
ncbi:hypothetical protein GN956_G20462 [Arapaima gigas]